MEHKRHLEFRDVHHVPATLNLLEQGRSPSTFAPSGGTEEFDTVVLFFFGDMLVMAADGLIAIISSAFGVGVTKKEFPMYFFIIT